MLEIDTSVEEAQAALLKALAHPFRIRILEEISGEEECVCHLSALFDKPQPFVSQHLAALKEAGLVVDRRVAQRVFYRTADPRIADLLDSSRVLSGAARERVKTTRPVPGCNCPKCNQDSQ